MNYFLATALAAFWVLINSQQNLAYMPAMNVNNPSHVNFYLGVIVEIAGFDPIPMDMLYENVLDFQWTN